MNNTLFADSGGTGTDWVYTNSEGDKVVFETESYHPVNWNEAFWKRLQLYWASNQNLFNYSLRFFGAGCLNAQNAQLLKDKFQSFGFQNVNVQSDLHAAGLASVQNGEGTIIIAGTGSVLFNFSNGNVSSIIGGKGHLLGDEGSGFFFGKLILEKYKTHSLTEAQLKILRTLVDLEALAQLDESRIKSEWATLSKILHPHKTEFRVVHEENIKGFISSHFKAEVPQSVSLVGSYAYHHKDLWKEALSLIHCNVDRAILKPIDYFIE